MVVTNYSTTLAANHGDVYTMAYQRTSMPVTYKHTANSVDDSQNPMRHGVLQYWGYISQIAEALAPPALKQARPLTVLGKDLVSHWAYRSADVYSSLDGAVTANAAWQNNPEQKPFPRFWHAFIEGSGAWTVQQLASAYVPASVVAGIRKGSASALLSQPLQPLNGKSGLKAVSAVIEAPVSVIARQCVQASKYVPGIRHALSKPIATRLLPNVLAAASIPLMAKPLHQLGNTTVNHTLKPGLEKLGHVFGVDKQSNPVVDSSHMLNPFIPQAFNGFSP